MRQVEDRTNKSTFHAITPAARLCRRLLRARGDGGGLSTPRRPAQAARRKAWRGLAWSGQAAQDGRGWRLRGLLGRRPRDGRFEEAGGGHICRGNSAGAWNAQGGYDAIAADFFPRLDVDVLLLEYDTPRAGDFAPLRHVLPQHSVVLGLLTTKHGQLEDAAMVEARMHEAAAYVPLERLALSPQCGFASVEAGNPITPDEQAAKLRLVTEVARRVWS